MSGQVGKGRVVSTGEIMKVAETITKDGTVTKLSPDGYTNVHKLAVDLYEYPYPTIFAGFQMDWGTVDIDGDELQLATGAGLGSSWATIKFRDAYYAISATQLVEAFLASVSPKEIS